MGKPAGMLHVVDEVFAIEKAEVLRAGEIVQSRALLSARDAVHIAAHCHEPKPFRRSRLAHY